MSLAFLGLSLGISLFISVRGVTINVPTNNIYPYFILLGIKLRTGKYNLKDFHEVRLQKFGQQQNMWVPGLPSKVTTKSFQLFLVGANTSLLLKEFTNLREAQSVLAKLALNVKLPAKDYYQTKLDKRTFGRR